MIENTKYTPAPVEKDSGEYIIGGVDVSKKYVIQMTAGSFATPIVTVEKSDPEPEPTDKVEKITIHEDNKNGVYTPAVNGVINYKGK